MEADVEVDLEEVRRAGRSMRSAADQTATVTPHADLPGIADAMPDSASARASDELETVWSRWFRRWVRATQRHADALTEAAEAYDEVDFAVADVWGEQGRPT